MDIAQEPVEAAPADRRSRLGWVTENALVRAVGRIPLPLGAKLTVGFAMIATLLVVGSSFFVADGIQTIVSGALRGLSDTRLPLLFAAISYWLIGFATAWGLAFPGRFGAIGVWIGLSCGTAVYALLLLLRFQWLSRRAIRSRLDRVAVVSPPP